MKDKIYEAKYIPSIDCPENFEKLDLSDVSKNNYNNYKGRLYCPQDNCFAPLVFVDEKRNRLKYFRSYPYSKKRGERHIDGCPHGIVHSMGKTSARTNGIVNIDGVSEDHIHRRIKDICKDILSSDEDNSGIKVKQKQKQATKRTNGESQVKKLIQEGNNVNKTREPNIPRKSIDDITTSDYSEGNNKSILAIDGIISGNVIVREDKNAYIDIFRKDHKKARVFFSEEFRTKSHRDSIDKFREYIDTLTDLKTVVCVGYIRKLGDYDINIYPSSEKWFAINGYFYGDMVNLLQTDIL